MMQKRVALHTLGCKANQADSTYLEGVLRQQGYKIVGSRDIADYYILNTCTVTDQADREARQLTRRVKKQNPTAKVIVTGCYAQTQPKKIGALESVDVVVGNGEKNEIPDLLPTIGAGPRARPVLGHPQGGAPTRHVSPIRQYNHVPSFGLSHYSRNVRPQVKIQDGCDKSCTYCIVPQARGKNRSVPPDRILNELKSLYCHGFKEAVLTGIHIGTYGLDLGTSLEQLLKLIDSTKPISRVRFSSLNPEELTDSLIDIVAKSEILCPHFHIAVQSGDNEILSRMKRLYQADRFYWVVDRITRAITDAAIGTDVIVGFPGETEEQFERSYRMIEKLPVSYVHVFPYSRRNGTAAIHLDGHLTPKIKRERTARLNKLSRKKRQQFYNRFLGHTMEVIVETKRDSEEGLLRGISPTYIPVHFVGDNSYYRQALPVTIDRINETRVYGHVA